MLTRSCWIQLVFGQKIAGRRQERLETTSKPVPPPSQRSLLNLDCCPSLGELLLDRLGFVFSDALFDRLRSAIDQVLGFLQTKTRNLAYRLDYVDLIGANFLKDDRELGLLFCRSRTCASRRTAARHHHRSRCRRRNAQ